MAVTDEAISRIKEMLLSGQLSPGDRLPPEKELSDTLGISRSSLREAVKALELIRVLDVKRGDGTYVTSLEPRLLLDSMSFVVDLHADTSVLEIFGVRRILEPAATAIAARRIDETTINGIAATLAEVNKDTSVEELVAHDLAFHRAVTEAAGNEFLTALLDALSTYTVRARVWRGTTQQGAVASTLDEHQQILNALRDRDAELALALSVTHIAGVERWLRSAL